MLDLHIFVICINILILKIELQNRVSQNDVTFRATHSKTFTEILFLSY